MAEKLNRDRSTRKLIRSASNNSNENQNLSPRQFSPSREENRDRRGPSLRKRDIQNDKTLMNYPPLEDYAE